MKKIPPRAPSPNLLSPRSAAWAVALSGALLALAALAAYSRTLSAPMLFDDLPSIVDNGTIRHWGAALSPPMTTTAGGRPVLNLTLAANFAISGTAVWSYHAFNIAIHILAGLTFFGILRRTKLPSKTGFSTSMAFSAALLWILHPLQTESVTYIVQRAESLMGLLYLLTLYCFIRGVASDQHSRLWYPLSAVSCLLGMATKEVMVSAPIIVLLYDRTFVSGSIQAALRQRKYFYGALGSTWILLIVLTLFNHGRGGSAGFGTSVSFSSYALTQFPALLRYLRLSVWPHPLIFYYGTEWVTWLALIVPSALVVVAMISLTLWALVQRDPPWRTIGFAGAAFFAILAPTSLVPVKLQTAAEHRMYLALAPIAATLVVAIYRYFGRWALPTCMVFSTLLFAVTFRRNDVYRSALSIWADTVEKLPTNAFAHHNLAFSLENIPNHLDEAITQYREALRLKPDLIEARTNLGKDLSSEGRIPEAVAELQAVLALKPDSAAAHNNLGFALEKLPGRLQDAMTQFDDALRLDPNLADAHNNLGVCYYTSGRLRDAVVQFETALRLKPDFAEAHYDLGNALQQETGHANDAIEQYEAALRLKPDYAEAENISWPTP